MSRRMRTYFYAVLGAIGGLIGWQVSDNLGLSIVANLYLSEVLVGGLIGLVIGLFIGITEGLLTQNLVQASKSGLFCAFLGALAGGIGLPLGEFLFQAVGAGILGRALGWAVFGLMLGLAEGITGKSQAWKGMLGGLIGGALGGVLLESAHNWLADPLTGKAAGLVFLGASVGAFISLIVVLLARAWLEVTSGKLKGTEFILDKFMRSGHPAVAIGSSPLKSEIVLPDPDIAPQHAMLTGDGRSFTLKDMSLAGTYINGKKIQATHLSNGQKIRMGNTEMVYHEKR
ncbi:MAG: FHA domain-containing protein [Anaerolineales bacterium]|nr:MAG: FHA domain-containing protein [Chloroflexota bacterium]MBE7434263.1 FHA domain-containing protein [Anaerolineales bacterium]MCE7860764.1 FHA domain-containing protein [Chloroflexi bacterium CFX2]